MISCENSLDANLMSLHFNTRFEPFIIKHMDGNTKFTFPLNFSNYNLVK